MYAWLLYWDDFDIATQHFYPGNISHGLTWTIFTVTWESFFFSTSSSLQLEKVTWSFVPTCRLPVAPALAMEKLKLLPEWMKAVFDMQSHSLLTARCPVFLLHPMKSCLKLVFRQVPMLLLLPVGTWCSGISLTMGQGDAPCLNVSLSDICGSVGAVVSL